jgi:carbamoyltransferase
MNQTNYAVLGISYGLNDSAAALIVNGKVIASAEEERFNREKHTKKFPFHSIQYVLNEAGLSLSEITDVAYYWNTNGRILERILLHGYELLIRVFSPVKFFKYLAGLLKDRAGYEVKDMLFPRKTLKRFFPDHKSNYKLTTENHHDTHAACTFLQSGFDRSAILIIDGSGEIECVSLYFGEGNKINFIESQKLPHSLGVFYGAVTEYLGFKKFDAEYKVMGLASYGKPSYYNDMKSILRYNNGINFSLDDDSFQFQYGEETWFSKKFNLLFGPNRKDDDSIEQKHMDIAASAQLVLEEILLDMCKYSLNKLNVNKLCFAGGVALNCSANGKIADKLNLDGFFVHPASHDGGTALGAALLVSSRKYNKQFAPGELPYLGPAYSNDEIESALKINSSIKYHLSKNIESELAEHISQGKVCCRFNGRMELGPRALGNRSILANPTDISIRDVINMKVKLREEFRPFAPSCLIEDFDTYFEGVKDPYMVFTQKAKSITKEKLPAIVHADGTARVQVVTPEINPSYYKLITEIKKRTGHGVVLNTSFNIQEPIVCSPKDALNTFCISNMDTLAIGDFIVEHVQQNPKICNTEMSFHDDGLLKTQK